MQKISTHGTGILISLLFLGISSTPLQQTHAAEPKKSLSGSKKVLAQSNAPQSASAVPSRALLDRYCVTCHNERLQTAGLMLDQVDFTDISRHAEVLEKVVRKLRAGQMPPEGRPKPDSQTVEAFLSSLESALDQSGLADQNPGPVSYTHLTLPTILRV